MDDRDLARLASCPLFAGIDPRELAAALAKLPHRAADIAQGNVALLAGCAYEDLRILLSGELSAEMTTEEGRTVVVESFHAPEAVATAVLFAPGRALPVTVVARSACRLAIIPRETLLSLSARFPPLLEALLTDMGARLSSLAEKLRALQFATLRERLADWLLRRASLAAPPPSGGHRLVRLEASKERLATLFGVARPSLSRELGELERRGLVEVRGRTIAILDPAGLAKLKPH